ncbi:MAG: hypothetical protein IH899_20550 [Planctomycetes bacterium]|nr:hypothetical protein [Planctomycetota bacterium]
MFTVSHAASELLAQMLSNDESSDDAVFRLVVKNDEIGLEIDTVQPGDSTFTHDERIVLVIDEEVSESVADITLDALVEGDSSDLVLIERFEGDEWDD